MATGQLSLVDSFNRWAGAKEGNCRLHPLIHTFIEFNLAHNAVGGQVNAVKKPPLTSPAPKASEGKKMGRVYPPTARPTR